MELELFAPIARTIQNTNPIFQRRFKQFPEYGEAQRAVVYQASNEWIMNWTDVSSLGERPLYDRRHHGPGRDRLWQPFSRHRNSSEFGSI